MSVSTNTSNQVHEFPISLFSWSNSGSYAISRSTDNDSGWQKPPLKTRLIIQMEKLADDIVNGNVSPCANIFLVGGPGNGKTHAAKYFLKQLLRDNYADLPQSTDGAISMNVADANSPIKNLRYIEDASAGLDNNSIYNRFVEDVERFALTRVDGTLFLCCVNRGILATVLAKLSKGEMHASPKARKFIAELSSVVSPDAVPARLWPYDDTKSVYIHPMDEESLLEPIGDNRPVAIDVLNEICSEDNGKCRSCPNARLCPIHANLRSLLDPSRRDSLLKILRYYEIVASRRLSFRDLFALFSQLIIGSAYDYSINGKKADPCKWVEKQVLLSNSNLLDERCTALFNLASALYHNKLFGDWNDLKVQMRECLKKARGLHGAPAKSTIPIFQMISAAIRRNASASSQNYLSKCASLLDPSRQDTAAAEGSDSQCLAKFRLIEDAFCKSLSLGVGTYLEDSECHPMDAEEKFFAEIRHIDQTPSILDMSVSDPDYQSVQSILSVLRIVLSRMAKRSIGATKAFVCDGDRLDEYRAMLVNDSSHPQLAARKRRLCSTIQEFLFPDGRFSCSMLATLGQLEPDEENGFFMRNLSRAQFSIAPGGGDGCMTRNLFFVNEPSLSLSIKVNFDIYSALVDIQNGMMTASLPSRIKDIFDGVKTRIQGRLCHNWDIGASSFTFFDRDGSRHSIGWNAEEGFFRTED